MDRGRFGRMRPLHFLVTDDDVDKRMLLSRALSRQFPHASIFECHSGREALEYVACNPIDAIVTNHSMQPVNGIELVTELRRQGRNLPIVMVAAAEHIREAAIDAGVDLFLSSENLIAIGRPIADYFRERGMQDRVENEVE
jgi:CheY-like chemotaxis protein